ncbi:MAG: hypothetical protein LC620_07735, partial [Halobacteriales archaeon]|nr:hypothetical protein [Halobacteriales archaeon]
MHTNFAPRHQPKKLGDVTALMVGTMGVMPLLRAPESSDPIYERFIAEEAELVSTLKALAEREGPDGVQRHAQAHFEKQVRRALRLRAYESLLTVTMSETPREEMMPHLLEKTREILDVEVAAVFLAPPGEKLHIQSKAGWPEGLANVGDGSLSRDNGVVAAILSSTVPLVFRQTTHAPEEGAILPLPTIQT